MPLTRYEILRQIEHADNNRLQSLACAQFEIGLFLDKNSHASFRALEQHIASAKAREIEIIDMKILLIRSEQ